MSLPTIAMQDIYDGWGRNIFRLGQDYELREGESAHDVVTVFSDATIQGTMRGDLVVIFGTVRVGPSATINGSLIAVGGNVDVQPGAAVRRDLVVIGGGLDAPPSFVPGGEHIAIGAKGIADRLHAIVPWLTEGLLLGRPIVPRLSWVWAIVGFTFLASIALTLLFLGSVRTCADAVAARPFTTFLVGLLVLLLTGPVSLILAASVIGIAVVPFVLCAVVVAWIIGKIGLTVRLGDTHGRTDAAGDAASDRALAGAWLRCDLPALHDPHRRADRMGARRRIGTWRRNDGVHVCLPSRESHAAKNTQAGADTAARGPDRSRPRHGPGDARGQRYPGVFDLSG